MGVKRGVADSCKHGQATQKATLSTFSVFLLTSFDAKEFLAKVGSLWYPALSCFLCTSCPPTSSAFPQFTSSMFGARTGFGRCLSSALHNSNSQCLMLMTSGLALCTTETFHMSHSLLARVGDPGCVPSCAVAPSAKLHKEKNLGLN